MNDKGIEVLELIKTQLGTVTEEYEGEATLQGDEFEAMVNSNTRKICSKLLSKLANLTREGSLTANDCELALQIQIVLLAHILYCEKIIQKLRNQNSPVFMIARFKERREKLRLLGSTLAWITLRFDHSYIRHLSRGHDSGFLSNGSGLLGEIYAVIENHNPEENRTAILHDITSNLKLGDVSITFGPQHGPIEVKSTTHSGLDTRGRRQMRKLNNIREYRETGVTRSLVPGLSIASFKHPTADRYNWTAFTKTAESAIRRGTGIEQPEDAITYFACKSEEVDNPDELIRNLKSRGPDRAPILGFIEHNAGMRDVMPFTAFDTTLQVKESMLFGEILTVAVVDLKSASDSLSGEGIASHPHDGLIDAEIGGKQLTIHKGIIDRLVYECLSVGTMIGYVRDTPYDDIIKKFGDSL